MPVSVVAGSAEKEIDASVLQKGGGVPNHRVGVGSCWDRNCWLGDRGATHLSTGFLQPPELCRGSVWLSTIKLRATPGSSDQPGGVQAREDLSSPCSMAEGQAAAQ